MRTLKTAVQRTKYNRNILSYGGLFISIKLFIPENPHLTGFLKALKRYNKTVNTGAFAHERGAHAECGKNYEIHFVETLTSVLNTKVKCKTSVKCPGIPWGMGGFGIDWHLIEALSLKDGIHTLKTSPQRLISFT